VPTDHNTVVLFDVENLLGDPGGWQQAVTRLSFGDILEQLRRDRSGLMGSFAVSRAYANWGMAFMGTLRREMTENGVEPRQIFAFDRPAKKNAADIELVIDALDLAYSRPALTTFVLVTRDGGFASLGRKLHELGKAVVVCADENCSKALRAVADAFVTLPDDGLSASDAPVDREGDRMLDEARAAALREVDKLAKAERAKLAGEGVPLTTVGQLFARTIPTLPVARSAYPGLREFLQWALADSRYCVFTRRDAPEGAQLRLGLRAGDHEALPDFERRPPQVSDTVAVYRRLAGQGKPPLRLADPRATAQVLQAVARTEIRDEDVETAINRVADSLAGTVTTTDVKNVVLALTQTAAMTGDGRYTLAKKSYANLRTALLDAVREKLARIVTVDESALQGLVAA
jgi:hypothetical protein